MITRTAYTSSSGVFEDGQNYIYSLLLDYEKIITTRGATTIGKFLRDWNLIPRSEFACLDEGDIVYDCFGQAYSIACCPWEDDAENLVVNAYPVRNDGTLGPTEDYFTGGDLYYSKYYHNWLFLKPKKTEGDKKICPILITSQAQHQN